MDHWAFGRAAVLAAALVGSSGAGAFSLGTWDCVAVDGLSVASDPGLIEATLSKKFFISDDGSVQIIDVFVEKAAAPRSAYQTIVDALLTRLGVERPLMFSDRMARIREADVTVPGIDWALSPRKPAGRGAWDPSC